MNSKLVSVLAAVCIACALIIIGEWFYAVLAQKHSLNSTISGETKTSHDEMPVIELTRQSEESYEDLVAKPLFIKGRRPVDEPKAEDAQKPASVVIFDWELNGVYTKNKSLSALFSRSKTKVPKDNFRKVAEGAELDGWKLTEIQKDRAILVQGDQQKELLLRKPKLKELPKKPNVPNIPGRPLPDTSVQPEANIPPEDSIIPDDSIQIDDSIPPEDSIPPDEGGFENNNEQY